MYVPIEINVDGVQLAVDGGNMGTPCVMVAASLIKEISPEKLLLVLRQSVELAYFARAIDAQACINDLGLDYLLQDSDDCKFLRELIDDMRPFRGRKLLGTSIDDTLSDAEQALTCVESRRNGSLVKRVACAIRRKQFAVKRPQIVLALIDRDGYKCVECGESRDLHVDHIEPLSCGGTDDLENLRFLCASCNSRKGDRRGR